MVWQEKQKKRAKRYLLLEDSVVGGKRLSGALEAVVLVGERYAHHGLRVAQRHQTGHVFLPHTRLSLLPIEIRYISQARCSASCQWRYGMSFKLEAFVLKKGSASKKLRYITQDN